MIPFLVIVLKNIWKLVGELQEIAICRFCNKKSTLSVAMARVDMVFYDRRRYSRLSPIVVIGRVSMQRTCTSKMT